MTLDRWEEIKNNVRKQFPDFETGTEDLITDTAEGQVKQGEAEFLVFASPIGRTKLQLQKKPKVEEKKYHYSHRAGDSARVEYKFSETDSVLTMKAYKWDDTEDEWKEIDASKIPNF